MEDGPPANGHAAYTLIRDLPAAERPRERLRDAGAAKLSNTELIAILLRVGGAKESAIEQAQRLLRDFQGLKGLAQSPFEELCNVHGIGEAKAAQLKAAIEIGVRAASYTADDRPEIRSADDVASLVMHDMSLLEQECVRVVLLDARNRVIGAPEVYRGSVHEAHVRIAELLRDAIRTNAASVILVHNHPSGSPLPSAADTDMTKKFREAGALFDIEVPDHLIIGGGRYASMRELGLGFPKGR
jgi:DNA repair protein RadC